MAQTQVPLAQSATASEGKRVPVRRSSAWTRKQRLVGWAFLAPFFAFFIIVFLIPVVVSIRSSLFAQVPKGEGLYGGGGTVETFVGLANISAAAQNPVFWKGVGRVMLFGAIQIPVMIIGALLLALLLDSMLVKRVAFFRLGYFLPYAIPGVIAAMVWVYMYTPQISPFTAVLPPGTNLMAPSVLLLSMANMTTWTYMGYNMLIFLAALQAIPHDLYEAARIDGASGWQVATKIKIPLVRGAALLAVLLSIIGTIQLFNEPTVMQTVNPWMGDAYTPMMMSYNTLLGRITPSGSGPANAISLLMALIAGALAAVYALVQRRGGDLA